MFTKWTLYIYIYIEMNFRTCVTLKWVQILDCTLTSITSPIHVLQFQNAPQPPSLLVHPSPQWGWVVPNGHLVDASSWWALLVVAHHHSLVARPTPWGSHWEEDHHNKRNTKEVNKKEMCVMKKVIRIWGISDMIEIELAVQRDFGYNVDWWSHVWRFTGRVVASPSPSLGSSASRLSPTTFQWNQHRNRGAKKGAGCSLKSLKRCEIKGWSRRRRYGHNRDPGISSWKMDWLKFHEVSNLLTHLTSGVRIDVHMYIHVYTHDVHPCQLELHFGVALP